MRQTDAAQRSPPRLHACACRPPAQPISRHRWGTQSAAVARGALRVVCVDGLVSCGGAVLADTQPCSLTARFLMGGGSGCGGGRGQAHAA